MVDLLHGTTGVVDALEDALCTTKKAQDVNTKMDICVVDAKLIRYGPEGRLQVTEEGFALLPRNRPSRSLESRQAPVYDSCNGLGSMCCRQGSRNESIEGGVAAGLVEDKPGQLLGAERETKASWVSVALRAMLSRPLAPSS